MIIRERPEEYIFSNKEQNISKIFQNGESAAHADANIFSLNSSDRHDEMIEAVYPRRKLRVGRPM